MNTGLWSQDEKQQEQIVSPEQSYQHPTKAYGPYPMANVIMFGTVQQKNTLRLLSHSKETYSKCSSMSLKHFVPKLVCL